MTKHSLLAIAAMLLLYLGASATVPAVEPMDGGVRALLALIGLALMIAGGHVLGRYEHAVRLDERAKLHDLYFKGRQ